MKRTFTLFATTLILLLSSLTLQAQNNSASISGTLVDESDQSLLDYAQVVLFKAQSTTPFKSTNSTENGTFTLGNLQAGTYRMEASMMGYRTWKKELILKAGESLNLGTIAMQSDVKELKVAEVTGIRSSMRLNIDKRVFSVDQNIASAGASASDILKDIPSVEVDQEGTISLRNNSNVTIWINGKPSGLNADNQAQVLEQLPAGSIDRVEIVTNPSSKFSAEGTGGIINIILKKDRKAGYFGSLRAGISQPLGYNLGSSLNYSSSKFDFYANIGLRNSKNEGSGTSTRETYSTNTLTSAMDTLWLHSRTDRNSGSNGLFFRSGIDYHLNDKHTISLSGFGMGGDRSSESNIVYDYLDASRKLDRSMSRFSTSGGNQMNMEITLDYKWEIGEEHSLQADLSYGKRSSTSDNSYGQTYFDASGDTLFATNQLQFGPGNSRDWEFQADYTRQLNKNYRIEAGLKSDWTVRTSDNSIFDTAVRSQNQVADFAGTFDYDEQIHAAYATVAGKVTQALGYQLGLRGELTRMDFTSTSEPGSNRLDKQRHYLNLFPSLFLSYSFSPGNDLQLNYSRRIRRPRGMNLNPFSDISDSTNIRHGNPDLEPEFSNSFELNHIRMWDNHTLSSSLYHRRSENVIQEIRFLSNGVLYSSPANVTTSSASGLEFVAKDKLAKWLETTSTVNFNHTRLNGFTHDNIAYKGTSGFSWNARMNATLILSPSLTGQLSGFYSAPRIISQGRINGSYSLDAGLRKSFLDRTLQVALNGRNLLNSFKFSGSSYGHGFRQFNTNQFMSRTLQLTLTWNFGNMKPKEKPGKEEGNEPRDTNGGMDMDF